MGQRLDLHTVFEGLLPDGKVYFQPPNNIQLEYPCIIYKRDFARTDFADNNPYRYSKRYQVTFITRDPDSEVPEKIARLPSCTFETFFTSSNLNHDVYTLFF